MLVPGDRDVCIKVGNRGWGTDPVGFSGTCQTPAGKIWAENYGDHGVCVIYCNIVIYNNI